MKKLKSKVFVKDLFAIDYILSTTKSMEDWLDDFTEWLESRKETISGTIRPIEEGEWNEDKRVKD